MPPKVPQVFASGETGGTPAGARLSPEGFAALSTSGIRAGARELSEAEASYKQIYTTLRTEQANLDAERALGEVQRQATDADIGLRNDPDVTPEQYPKLLDEQLRVIRQGVSKSLQYPESRLAFERGVERFISQKSTAAKYEGLERLHAQVRATTDMVLREDVNAAVFGATPEIQEEALNRALSRISGLTRQRIYSGAEASAKSLQVLSQVEQGRIRRDFKNPVLAPGIIAGLRRGEYTSLGVEGQRELANSLETEQRELDERLKKERTDAEKEVADEAEKGITDAISAGNWNAARGFLTSARKFLPATRYEHWKDTIANREGKGAPSDPVLYKTLNSEVNSIKGDPTLELNAASLVRDRIEAAYRENRLDDKDYGHLIDRANNRITRTQDKTLTALGREHAQAEQMITEALRVNGPAAAILDTQAQAVKTMALEDLSRNSAYLGKGNESPLAWFNRRRVFYQSQLGTIANQRLAQTERELGTIRTKADLLARRGEFRTEADFLDKVRLLREADALRKAIEDNKGGAGTGGGPSGASNLPTPTPASGGTRQLGRSRQP